MCARFLPWHTGSIAIKGRNSSTLASSDILKQSKIYSRGGRGARLFAWTSVCVCVGMRMREGVPDIRSQKSEDGAFVTFPASYI